MEKTRSQLTVIILVVLLILAAGVIGWLWGNKDNPVTTQLQSADQPAGSDTADIKSLINYRLPDGWKEARCAAMPTAVYVIPAGAGDVACEANPSAPVKISVDSGATKDCNELQNNTNVKKHVCISLYINGHRSLKASTEYLASSSYGQPTTINVYYIDIGGDVIKVEYVFNADNKYEAGFDHLANSISN